jgi:hypothetical protein
MRPYTGTARTKREGGIHKIFGIRGGGLGESMTGGCIHVACEGQDAHRGSRCKMVCRPYALQLPRIL